METKVEMEGKIREVLKKVVVPGVVRDVVGLNLVREVTFADGHAKIVFASTALHEGAREWLKESAKKTIEMMEGVEKISVEFVDAKPSELNRIGKIVAVMSGKGGVGKSLVASLVAIALKRMGHEVGILDADITGPSIPRMFGIDGKPEGNEAEILPVCSRTGIEIMSINLLLPSEDEAVIWRGPLISKVITQFGQDVLWGNLDYLIVDLPPGTADAPLTVLQSFPISGVIIVYTPQDLVEMIVKKAVNMAKTMNKPVLGVVENMSYFYVPELDKKIEVFGPSRGEKMSIAAQAPLLGLLPLDPALTTLCDRGDIERYSGDFMDGLDGSLTRVLAAAGT
jgi:hydrogenase maturation protease